MNLYTSFIHRIDTVGQFTRSDKLLVALSGGVDSVVLLHMLLRAGFDCSAAHCNFQLRGDESIRDEEFVRALCSSCKVPLEVRQFDTKEYAQTHSISIEMAARDLRYAFFDELLLTKSYTYLLVAHHRDDSVETILLNLVRGTGIKGLVGMKEKSGTTLRPLLSFSRKEIECYAQKNNISFVVDSTNHKNDFKRNKLRNQLIPLFESLNPSFNRSVAESAAALGDVLSIYEREIARQKSLCVDTESDSDCVYIDIEKLLLFPESRTLLFEIMRDYGFNSSVCKDIYAALTGLSGTLFYSESYRVMKDRGKLIVTSKEIVGTRSCSFSLDDTSTTLPLPLSWDIYGIDTMPDVIKSPNYAFLDLDKLGAGRLMLRSYQTGDWFIPYGMNGRKKLSDFFVDKKMSLPDKEGLLLLCSSRGDIAWVVGHRVDNRFSVTSSTRRVVVFRLL